MAGKRKSKLIFLGCGSSSGVPVIGCSCATCLSPHRKDKRTRSSIYLELPQGQILVDVSPDFRQQALEHAIVSPPHALLLTHTHYDHVGGLEELRVYNFLSGRSIPCYLSHESYKSLEKMYYYHFLPKSDEKSYSASFDYHVLPASRGNFELLGKEVSYCTYTQGTMPVLGFRFGSIAYLTDVKEYDDTAVELARGVHTLIISATKYSGSKMQLSVNEALEFISKVRPRRAILMHMSHDLGYETLARGLPSGVEPAFDGMKIDFDW